MFSLILVAITIAILSALAVVAINYTPWWIGRAQIAHEVAADGFATLERAYELASAAAMPADTPPGVTGNLDGGVQARLKPYAGFVPKAPPGMSWKYGHQAVAGAFEGLDYVCLHGDATDFAEYKGAMRLADTWGSSQAVLAGQCGAVTPTGAPSSFPGPVALTYYMQYVPGVR